MRRSARPGRNDGRRFVVGEAAWMIVAGSATSRRRGSLGSYRFCDRHYERALRQRGSLWRADLVSLLAVGIFVLVVYLLDAALNPRLSGGALVAAGLVIALIPTAIWFVFFYQWDRLEPEPKTLVLRVALLGALAAAALAIPLVESVFDIGAWLNRGIVSQVLGNIFVVGFVQMGLVYLVVRLSVYESPEFDEWTDGILYGTAAGLGLATVLNLEFIIGSGGADLGLAAIRVALTALVLASLGGLVGYFLGHDRLEVRPGLVRPGGRRARRRPRRHLLVPPLLAERRPPERHLDHLDRPHPRRDPCRGRDRLPRDRGPQRARRAFKGTGGGAAGGPAPVTQGAR